MKSVQTFAYSKMFGVYFAFIHDFDRLHLFYFLNGKIEKNPIVSVKISSLLKKFCDSLKGSFMKVK